MSIKISALPSIGQEGRSLNSVIPIVDSGNTTTNKIDLLSLFGNNPDYVSVENLDQRNFIASCGTNINNPSSNEIGFRGSASGNTILSSSGYIENSTNSILAGTIAGGSGTYINNGSQIVVMGSFRSSINGGERSAIIGCEDANISNTYNGAIIAQSGGQLNTGPSFMAGGQGGTINGSRSVHIGSEAGTTNSSLSGQYNSYSTDISGNLYNVAIGSFQGNINSLGGSMENATLIGTRSCQIDHQGASIISAESVISLYDRTLHSQHLYSYGQTSNGHEDNGTSNNFDINWNEGNTQEIEMNGDTTISFSNVRNGATYVLKVVNGGTHSITSVSASGYTIKCEGGSIPNITNNGEDLCILEVIGTDIFVRHFADFSTP